MTIAANAHPNPAGLESGTFRRGSDVARRVERIATLMTMALMSLDRGTALAIVRARMGT